MEIQLATGEFREALQKAKLAIPTHANLPILYNARLTCDDMSAKLTTTNLEQAIEISLSGYSASRFDLVFPCRTVLGFLGKTYKGDVRIKSSDKLVELELSHLGIAQFDTGGGLLNIKDFPPIPDTETLIELTVDGKWFSRMASIVAQHCEKSDTRPILTGVVFDHLGSIAALDGFRLAVVQHKSLEYKTTAKDVVVPGKTMLIVSRLFAKSSELKIRLGETYSTFEADCIKLTTQNVQGNFPDYLRLIPQASEHKVGFSAPLMLGRLSMMQIDEKETIRFTFSSREEGELLCRNDSGAGFRVTMPIVVGDECKVAMCKKYVVPAIRPFAMVEMSIANPSSPVLIKGDIEELTIVIMPIFAQW